MIGTVILVDDICGQRWYICDKGDLDGGTDEIKQRHILKIVIVYDSMD